MNIKFIFAVEIFLMVGFIEGNKRTYYNFMSKKTERKHVLLLKSPKEIEMTGLNFPQQWKSKLCNEHFVTGVAAKINPNPSSSDAKIAQISGLKFVCGNGRQNFNFSLEGSSGSSRSSDEWSSENKCDNGKFVGFQLKAKLRDHSRRHDKTEWTGITGIALYCFDKSNYKFNFIKLEVELANNGEWTPPQFCPEGTLICGAKTLLDLKGTLKDANFYCCKENATVELEESAFSHRRIKGTIIRNPNYNPGYYFNNSKSGPHRFANQLENFFLLETFNRPYWQFWKFCQDVSYVAGLQLHLADITPNKTIIDGVKLRCVNPIEYLTENTFISDQAKYDDNAGNEVKCRGAKVVVGFQVLHDSYSEIQNIRLFCSHEPNDYVEGNLEIPGGKMHKYKSMDEDLIDYFDESDEKKETVVRWNVHTNKKPTVVKQMAKRNWLEKQMCKMGEAVCGFKLNAGAAWQEGIGLFDLQMKCCHVPRLSESCFPEDSWELILERDNTEGIGDITQLYRQVTGVSTTRDKSKKEELSDHFYKSLNIDESTSQSSSIGASNRLSNDLTNTYGTSSTSGFGSIDSEGSSKFRGNGSTVSTSHDDGRGTNTYTGGTQSERTGQGTSTNSESSNTRGGGTSSSTSNTKESSSSNTIGGSAGIDTSHSVSVGGSFLGFSAQASAELKTSFQVSHSRTYGSSESESHSYSVNDQYENTRGSSEGKQTQESNSVQRNINKALSSEKVLTKSQANSWAKKYGENKEKSQGTSVDSNVAGSETLAISSFIDKSSQDKVEVGTRKGETKGSGFTTGYNWGSSSSETWNVETTREVQFQIPAGVKSRLYQAVGKCSYYHVRTTLFKRIDNYKENLMVELEKTLDVVLRKLNASNCDEINF